MNYIISIIVIAMSFYLFKKSAGTMKINLINILSYSFYSLMLFEFIGVTLVFGGFRNHYLIRKISSDNIIFITYWATAYVMIILPLIIYLVNKYLYKIDKMDEKYIDNINKPVYQENKKNQDRVYILVTLAMIICIIAIVYVFSCVGYIPLMKYLDTSFDFAKERIRIGRNFSGNIYIKNIVVLMVIPLLSHIAYAYMRVTKEHRWKILFIILFIMSILAKTMDFAKAPIIYYICFFFIIETMLGNTQKLKTVLPYFVVAIVLVVILYATVANYSGKFFSLSNGPISRVIISQAGTLFLHFDTFPNLSPYLRGHSFPPFTKFIFGEGTYDIRSGRTVMEVYNHEAIENGTAGVMSTMFLGEAYANFGWIGVIISPVLVGIILSSILAIYLKSKKTPLNIILYLESFIIFTTVLQAGFIDFFYNIQFFATVLGILGIKIISSETFEIYVNNIIKKCKLKNIKENK